MAEEYSRSAESVTNRILFVGCSLDEYQEVLLSLKAASDPVVVLPTISIENVVAMVKQLNIGYLIIGKRISISDLTALIAQIREANEHIKTLLYFDAENQHVDLKYLINGVHACLHREADSSSLLAAIKAVEAGGIYLSPIVLEQLRKNSVLEVGYDAKGLLSHRERQVANFIVSGLSIKEVAELTKLSSSAISTYKRRVFEKLGVKSVVELLSLEALDAALS